MLLKYRLQNIKCEIKWAWQRVFRGYDDRVVWNLNSYFLEYIPKILKQMNEGHCGHPCELTDKQWENILNKMIYCFTEANEDTCSKVNKYQEEYDQMWEDFTNEFGYFGNKLPQPEDCIKKGSTRMYSPYDKEINRKDWKKLADKFTTENIKISLYRENKLNEGLELFSRYFWNLWD